MINYKDFHHNWCSMYWVDTDYKNNCSLYVVRDDGLFGWWSYVYCNTKTYKKTSKTIRLYVSIPCKIISNLRYFYKTKPWNIEENGYDKILMELLNTSNSKYGDVTNWERTWQLMNLHGYHPQMEWQKLVPETIPDYEHLWGTSNWKYLDYDPDDCIWVEINSQYNMSIYASANHWNILRPEEEEESGILVFDDCERYRAKRVAKISVFGPKYLLYHPHSYACKKTIWRLNDEEKKILMKLLKMRHRSDKRKTNWQYTLDTLKWEGFHKYDEISGKYIEYEDFKTDLPMPDYNLLPD